MASQRGRAGGQRQPGAGPFGSPAQTVKAIGPGSVADRACADQAAGRIG